MPITADLETVDLPYSSYDIQQTISDFEHLRESVDILFVYRLD